MLPSLVTTRFRPHQCWVLSTSRRKTCSAPGGTQLICKNWLIEAAYRMLQNNLAPEVAFNPDNLIVYGGQTDTCTCSAGASVAQLLLSPYQ